jgi:hypothetical protein
MTPGAALLVTLLSQGPTVAPNAPSEAAPTRVRLEVKASSECTSRGDLASRIAARSSRIEVDDEAPLAAQVVVTSPHPGRVVGDLVLGPVGSAEPPRRVVARTCAEAADGLALIIAVTLDPKLRRRAPGNADRDHAAGAGAKGTNPAQGADQPKNSAPGASTKASAPPPTAAPGERPAPEAPAPPLVPAAPPIEHVPVLGTPMRRELGVSLDGQTIFGPAPSVLPGIAVYVTAALDRPGPWSPALTLGGTHVWRSDLPQTGGAASFTLDAANLDACPLRWRWAHLTARPCATALVGRLASQGSGAPMQAGASRPFAAAGAALAFGFGAKLEVSGRLGVGVTLLRDSYEFANDVFYRAAAVTISASLGVGMRWP